MAYTVPNFPITVKVWHAVAVPPVGAPAFTVMGNLTPGVRTLALTAAAVAGEMFCLLPKLTDIRIADVAEIPGGTTRYYSVIFVDDIAKGFSNEHRFAVLRQAAPWPIPTP